MLRNGTKPKKVHWIPPGRLSRSKTSSKESESEISSTASKPLYPKENQEIASISSTVASVENKDDSSIYLNDIKQQHKVLYLYYMSLRPVFQKLKRLLGNLDIQDDTIEELVSKVEIELNNLFGSLEDLEFLISLFENALSESSHTDSLKKIIRTKDCLLTRLFDCYQDISKIFLVSHEKLSSRDTKEIEKERDNFMKRYQIQEKKNQSQSAVLKDLERQLSIMQGKYHAVEGYNKTLEETKAEFQNMIHEKDVQIKSLTSELTKLSLKQDDEKWIELIEEMGIKAKTEKQALKKAMKAQKLAQKVYNEDRKQQLKALEEENEKKTKMLLDLAAERDKLRVQMTVTNNELVQARYHIEEIKSQSLKLQNELSESNINYKTQNQEKSEVFTKQLKEKEENELKLKNAIKHLEEELNAAVKESEVLKSRHDSIKTSLLQAQNEHSVDKVFDEVRSLTSLLQVTKEQFQNFKSPTVLAAVDNHKNEKNLDNGNVVAMLQDMRKELLEIKRHDVCGNQCDKSSQSDLLTEMETLKEKYKSMIEENSVLKRQLKEMENPPFPRSMIDENYSTTAESNFPTRDLQLQLALKSEEVWKYKQREKKLEYQLEEVKDKLQKKEMENIRLFSLEESLRKTEEELKSKKYELSVLEQRKQEEADRLLKRTKDLQEALDESTAKNELLSRHIDMLKVSLYNVFGES